MHSNRLKTMCSKEDTTADDASVEPEMAKRPTLRSLNDAYGTNKGAWQSLSLLLNAGLMVYAHFGLSAVVVSNQPNIKSALSISLETPIESNDAIDAVDLFNQTGACIEDDFLIWDGLVRGESSDALDRCIFRFGESPCLSDVGCVTGCFEVESGYTTECASCFGKIPSCLLAKGCLGACTADKASDVCKECAIPCDEDFDSCSGLPKKIYETNNSTATLAPSDSQSGPESSSSSNNTSTSPSEMSPAVCEPLGENSSADDAEDYFDVYEIMFFTAIKTAWMSGARFLAIVVVLFSGSWPYAKNLILMIAWYLPLHDKNRSSIFMWLKRVGKYTLVDVYMVIIVMIGVASEVTLAGDLDLVLKGEPRSALIAFLVATIWEFFHIEWMVNLHEKTTRRESRFGEPPKDVLSALRFQRDRSSNHNSLVCANPLSSRYVSSALLGCTTLLFITGSFMELISFTTVKSGEAEGCVTSYNLYTLGGNLISDFFFQTNSAKPAVWTLFVTYILLIIAVPLVVHAIHVYVLVFNKKGETLCKVCDCCWTFASVEVLLLSVYTVQSKFSDLIAGVAGTAGSELLGIDAQLGLGFWILIAYCVAGGLIHYIFNSSVAEYYQIEPYRKINFLWTKLFGSFLRSEHQY